MRIEVTTTQELTDPREWVTALLAAVPAGDREVVRGLLNAAARDAAEDARYGQGLPRGREVYQWAAALDAATRRP